MDAASKADIFARLASVETEAGPFVLLAFEISPIPLLPHYCYFPFNLKDRDHRSFLESWVRTGEIRFHFRTERQTLERTHSIGPYLCSRAAELYAKSLHTLEKRGRSGFDFEEALRLAERFVRIPELLEHAVSERDLAEIRKHISETAQQVPNEKRENARRAVQEIVLTLKPSYQKNEKSLSEKALLVRRGLLYFDDVRRLFAYDLDGLVSFLGDAIAANLPETEIENLRMWNNIAAQLLQIPWAQIVVAEVEKSTAVPVPPSGLDSILQKMSSRGISEKSLTQLAESLGVTVGAKSGRSIEDYSWAYEFKARLFFWSKVARKALEEDQRLRAEFGERSYDQLDYETQQRLKRRIREGVKQYAKRNGKSFPVPRLTPV